MQSSELIRLIAECDPDGNMQVCIGNADIQDVTVEPAYYDGALQVIEFDANRHPVIGRRIRSGQKMVLDTLHISEAIHHYPNFRVEYQDDADRTRYSAIDEETRRAALQIDFDIDEGSFVDWVFIKIQVIRKVPIAWVQRIKEAASAFYRDNKLGPDNPVIRVRPGRSYADCREEYYEENFTVSWDNYSRIVITRKLSGKDADSPVRPADK